MAARHPQRQRHSSRRVLMAEQRSRHSRVRTMSNCSRSRGCSSLERSRNHQRQQGSVHPSLCRFRRLTMRPVSSDGGAFCAATALRAAITARRTRSIATTWPRPRTRVWRSSAAWTSVRSGHPNTRIGQAIGCLMCACSIVPGSALAVRSGRFAPAACFLAAGTLGSTEILLRSRQRYGVNYRTTSGHRFLRQRRRDRLQLQRSGTGERVRLGPRRACRRGRSARRSPACSTSAPTNSRLMIQEGAVPGALSVAAAAARTVHRAGHASAGGRHLRLELQAPAARARQPAAGRPPRGHRADTGLLVMSRDDGKGVMQPRARSAAGRLAVVQAAGCSIGTSRSVSHRSPAPPAAVTSSTRSGRDCSAAGS